MARREPCRVVRQGTAPPGRVLELGCGHGRNAMYMASLGCGVDAVDFPARAIEWAKERAEQAGAPVSCPSEFSVLPHLRCDGHRRGLRPRLRRGLLPPS